MSCTYYLHPSISAFCLWCKELRHPDWTTGNKSLDSFIMSSWHNMRQIYDGYLQWIEYAQLVNIQERPMLGHGCSHAADWSKSIRNEDKLVKVKLKKITNGQDTQVFDFYQVN